MPIAELSAQPITDLIEMIKQSNKNQKQDTNNSITNNFIILIFSIISLFIESIVVLISMFRNGILKKEILSNETELGFDLVIKRK